METSANNKFDEAMARYQAGAAASDVLADFLQITETEPGQSAGWTCLSWLQLLCDQPQDALRSARLRREIQCPRSLKRRINLSLALLETTIQRSARPHSRWCKQVIDLCSWNAAGDLKTSID